MQGDYGLWQCSRALSSETYDNEAIVHEMVRSQTNRRIPSALIPLLSPGRGKPMSMNLRIDAAFVEDEGWHAATERAAHFLRRHKRKRVLFLELGVGMNTPGILKFPFWRMTAQNPKAAYACLNLNEAYAPSKIAKQAICIQADLRDVLNKILNEKRTELPNVKEKLWEAAEQKRLPFFGKLIKPTKKTRREN